MNDREGIDAVDRIEHDVASALEDRARHASHDGVVLHEQHRSVRGTGRRRRCPLGSRAMCGAGGLREIDLECCTALGLAVDPNAAPQLLDDPEDRRQAEPSPAPLRFRGEKGLKDSGLCRGIHADSGVGHGQDRVRARSRRMVLGR